MGLWNLLFRSDGGGGADSVRVRESKADNARVTADKYSHHGGDSHGHRSYDLDRASGSYREYSGGENSSDRSSGRK